MERYVPSPAAARDAVGKALNAWQKGLPTGPLPGTRPQVAVVDNARRSGQRLARFEILGEVAAQDGRCIAVRVALENPTETKFVRFIVLGIDPLIVYRQDGSSHYSPWLRPMEMDGSSEEKPDGTGQPAAQASAPGAATTR
jgi:hypothetical protein